MKSSADNNRATEQSQPTAPAENTPAAAHPTETAPKQTADQWLVVRIKGAIDHTGRYKNRLSDMSAGYSAGQGIPFLDARKSIEEKFTAELGLTPHQYLHRHYAARRKEAQRAEKESKPSPALTMDRER